MLDAVTATSILAKAAAVRARIVAAYGADGAWARANAGDADALAAAKQLVEAANVAAIMLKSRIFRLIDDCASPV